MCIWSQRSENVHIQKKTTGTAADHQIQTETPETPVFIWLHSKLGKIMSEKAIECTVERQRWLDRVHTHAHTHTNIDLTLWEWQKQLLAWTGGHVRSQHWGKNKFFNPGGCLRCELLDHMALQGYEHFPRYVCLCENKKQRMSVCLCAWLFQDCFSSAVLVCLFFSCKKNLNTNRQISRPKKNIIDISLCFNNKKKCIFFWKRSKKCIKF